MKVVLIGCTNERRRCMGAPLPQRMAAGRCGRPRIGGPPLHAAPPPAARHWLTVFLSFWVGFAQVAQAKFVKQMCDENLGPTWHVIAGRAYAVSVSGAPRIAARPHARTHGSLWRRGHSSGMQRGTWHMSGMQPNSATTWRRLLPLQVTHETRRYMHFYVDRAQLDACCDTAQRVATQRNMLD